MASIFDKNLKRELLASPARLAISYDNPQEWPAWNMDWDQEQAAPKEYVSGPTKVRIVENGPVRVGLEITRETAGSRFVQTIFLSAGDAGKRVEFSNVIDWNTRESNLKAVFPLTASNHLATYNWDIGTIERPTADPKKFEVPSHQWIDLTDMSGEFGATILTDCKNGSDKPNDNTLRLTLIRTPGTAGGYTDQGTQDIGHHEFVYGLSGHAGGWRDSQTDWQAQRLNAPLIAFETSRHAGGLGRDFSLLKINNPRIRILALKKAEQSDEIVLRMVELDGKPQPDVKISFATPITAAREVNGQEQPVGPAVVKDGVLLASFGAYQPRTFALRLRSFITKLQPTISASVSLPYDLAAATNDDSASTDGFDGKGNSYPAEMLPSKILFDDVQFHLAAAKSGMPNALRANGQQITLPAGSFNRLYLLAAATNGDQTAAFSVGANETNLKIQDWGGFVGQWDDREWSSADTSHDDYGDMIGLKPGFIKRADLAWYCDHYHDAKGRNVAYQYSYLFGYALVIPAGAKTLTLPQNENVRILAVSVANEDATVTPVQPLYDVLPSANAGPPDFTVSISSPNLSIPQGHSAKTRVVLMRRGTFSEPAKLSVSGLPSGVTASFDPPETLTSSMMTLTADKAANPQKSSITVRAVAADLSRSASTSVTITPVFRNSLPVDLSSAYNVAGIYNDGHTFTPETSLDGDGFAFSAQQLGTEQVGNGAVFKIGPANAPDMVTGKTVSLPEEKFASVNLLALGVNGSQELQTFTLTYSDGSTSSFSQNLSDWAVPANFPNESPAVTMPYRLAADGSKDTRAFYAYSYSFKVDPAKRVHSLTLPSNRDVLVLAITLLPADSSSK